MLTMLYPVSSGPIAVLAMRMNNGTFIKIVDRVYDPLFDGADLVDRVTQIGAEQMVSSYVAWWCKITNTRRPE